MLDAPTIKPSRALTPEELERFWYEVGSATASKLGAMEFCLWADFEVGRPETKPWSYERRDPGKPWISPMVRGLAS